MNRVAQLVRATGLPQWRALAAAWRVMSVRSRPLFCFLFGHVEWLQPTKYGRSIGLKPVQLLRCSRCSHEFSPNK